jgi:hypothetical protein
MPSVANQRTNRSLLPVRAGLLALALALPAAAPGQTAEGGPKSLLPPDLLGPAPAPPAAAPVPPGTAAAAPPSAAAPAASPPAPAEPSAPPALPALFRPPAAIAVPPDPLAGLLENGAPAASAGLLDASNGGYGADLFQGADGRFLLLLLARIDGPLASRWGQILLQRVLLSRAAPPDGVRPGDWLAGRALALVQMGSAADAHRMILPVDSGQFTAALYAVSAEAALASADPVALCPMAATAVALTDTPLWTMADGYCSAMAGDEYGASVRFDQLAGGKAVAAFDLALAQQTASALAGNAGRAGAVWDKVGVLTPWRIGLAAAGGTAIPEPLVSRAAPAMRAWIARLPGVPIATRAAVAVEAGALGVLSAAEVDRILAAETETLDPAAAGDSPGGHIRIASAADQATDRLAALAELWQRGGKDDRLRYGWMVATAVPAGRLLVSDRALERAGEIAEALMAAGMTPAASRWWAASARADADVRARVWAAVVAADRGVILDVELFDRWAKAQPPHRAHLLAAGLSGLGRGTLGGPGVAIDNDWTRALDAAARARRAGEVVVLAAVGLHGAWADIPPDYLRRIAAALRAVGMEKEAALIVAEAAVRG